MPAQRLFVHVGLQKTGTSYLQAVLLGNADRLAAQGLDLVPPTKRGSFELMLNLRERYDPERDPASVGDALERFASDLADAPGDRAVFSQESLAAARPEQIERLLAACGKRELHVIATVRDLTRQLPSSWQQMIKAGKDTSWPDYLARLQRMQRAGRTGHPWIHLDPPAVLATWASVVSAQRVHVVTVPPPGAAPTLVLERFCRVLEVDAEGLEPESSPANTSLGRTQTEVLRRVNALLPEELLRRQVYGDVGKRYLAARVLADQSGERIRVPGQLRPWCEEVAAGQIRALAESGYRIEGDLEDLACRPETFTDDDREPEPEEIAESAVAALSRVVELRARATRGGRRGSRSESPSRPRSGVERVRRLAARLRG